MYPDNDSLAKASAGPRLESVWEGTTYNCRYLEEIEGDLLLPYLQTIYHSERLTIITPTL